MDMIDKNKTYRTRDGREVRIYATDGGGSLPIHGAIKDEDGEWEVENWHSDGEWVDEGGSNCDLIEVKQRIKRTVWLSIYPNHVSSFFDAESATFPQKRIACVKVEIDCEEGEGL